MTKYVAWYWYTLTHIRTQTRIYKRLFSWPTSAPRHREVDVGALLKLEDDEFKDEYFPLEKSVSWAEKSGGMLSAEADQLRAHGALFEETDCSDTRNWPDARGVFMSNNKKLFVHINKEEHVSFFCVGTAGEGAIHFQEMFKNICKALSSSEASIFDEEQ